MIKLKDNKGITLMSHVLTIVILLIILGVITYSSMSNMKVKELNNMYSDIVSIQEKAINYYYKYKEAPIDKTALVSINNVPKSQINPNDESNKYYKVDFSKLLNVSLNNKQSSEDYYYINEKTLTIYYSKGVKIKESNVEVTYYTLPSNYEGVKMFDLSVYQNEI